VIRIRRNSAVTDPPVILLLQQAADICDFSGPSFTILSATVSTLIAAISTLFGMLMLSFRSRIQSAEKREQDANHEKDEAVRERNEALWRLEETRTQYRDFAVETQNTVRRQRPRLPAPRRSPPGDGR
jgi:hypothetical protein